jgi:hypothetical protein
MLACHGSPFQMESRPLFANASHKKGIKSKASDPTVKRRTLHLVSSIKSRKDLRKNAHKKQRKRSKTHIATAKTATTLQWENAAGGGRRRDKGRARSPMVIFTTRLTYLSALLPSFPQSIKMMDASDGHESLSGRDK